MKNTKNKKIKNILNKFDNFLNLLNTCNEVLQKHTLSELVSELYKIHIAETSNDQLAKLVSKQIKYIENVDEPLTIKLDDKKLKNLVANSILREKLKLKDENKTIFEQLKESYYKVNYLIPATNLLSLFDKHQSKSDTVVFQCHEMYGKDFANKLHEYYGFSFKTTSELQTKYNFDRTLSPHKNYISHQDYIPLVSFEKEILDFLELHPTLMEKFEDCVLTRKNAKLGGIFMMLLAAASGGYYWLNSDASNED